MNSVIHVKDEEDFKLKLEEAKKSLVVVHFWAIWAEQCKQMSDVMDVLAKQNPNVVFLAVEGEEIPEVSQMYEVEAVPTFFFIKNNQTVGRLDGAHAPELTKLVKQHADTIAPVKKAPSDPKEDLDNRIKSLINSAPCVLFMKGTAATPRCGFSRQMISILNENNCKYSTFDILQDEAVRQRLKEYSNWPTYPQLYVDGNLIGGLDVVRDMATDGELRDVLPKLEKNAAVNDRIKKIISETRVVIFMKGEPRMPRCGFSREMIHLLNQTGIEYTHYNILNDEEIRQGLKKFSKWPTYPQLYVDGVFVGGIDIIKEMSDQELLEVVQGTSS